jgi:sec-independent protein translocase protein TatA
LKIFLLQTANCKLHTSASSIIRHHINRLQERIIDSTCTMKSSIVRVLTLMATLWVSQGFAPVSQAFRSAAPKVATPFQTAAEMPAALQRQRKSIAPVQTMGLFGLGAPEIAIIFVAAAFLLGPEKLAELGKDAGKIAGELKEVPKEFQKGLDEGEKSAKSMKKVEAPKGEIAEAEKEVEKQE